MDQIRLLTAREIECRVSQIMKKGDAVILLLFKDARVDMNILDETFGPLNWQRHHSRDNANCIVSIWDESKGQWIEKEDVGTESNTEAIKGLASDSFKRACFNVGIGRELYTAPFIYVKKSPDVEIESDDRGKFRCNTRFEVQEIGYNEHREIDRLVIINAKTHNVVYQYGKPQNGATSPNKAAASVVDESVAQKPEAAEMPVTVAQNRSVRHADDAVTCERCFKVITGKVLNDGTKMTAAEIIGKSKLTYNGVYCWDCALALKSAKDKKDSNARRKAG